MATIICSARHDEKKKYTGGKVGDQLQSGSGNDFKGEVSMQYLKDFIGNKKWYILRPKKAAHAIAIAEAMRTAGNNINIGYSQGCQRKTVDDVCTKTKINVDCSKLVRDCIFKATNIDVGNFTTANEVKILESSKLFDKAIVYTTNSKLYQGDVLVTQQKGHTGIVIDGLSRVGITPKPTYMYGGVDYAKVFDPTYYANQNSDVKKVYGTNSTLLFNHFIKFGCNESSRWGRTIAGFNVHAYATAKSNDDLVKVFGKLKDNGQNGFVYYKHFCEFGYKENRVVV